MVKLKNDLTKEKERRRFPNFLTQVLAFSQISSTGFWAEHWGQTGYKLKTIHFFLVAINLF
jgi:hypothetical protein